MQTCRVCYGSNISFHPQFRQRPGLHRCQSQQEDRQSTKHSNLIMKITIMHLFQPYYDVICLNDYTHYEVVCTKNTHQTRQWFPTRKCKIEPFLSKVLVPS